MTTAQTPAARRAGPTLLETRAGTIDLAAGPAVMGILNVTPDSFSDGGKYMSPEDAIARAEVMAEEGADVIDIGGESSRPGAAPVSVEEELARVLPVVELLAARLPKIPLSVDTAKAEVARRCLEAGASIINDISSLRDPAMPNVLEEHGVPVVLMHMKGTPGDMQKDPQYRDVRAEIAEFFREKLAFMASRGLTNSVILDPGVGFGKNLQHNLEILRDLTYLLDMGRPVMLGTSRKSFLGRLLAESPDNPLPPEERGEATLASHLWAAQQGASFLRVHDVRSARRSLKIWRALAAGRV